MSDDEHIEFPTGWLRAMQYETIAEHLWHASLKASPKVAEALAPCRWMQPPRPGDHLAAVGATIRQSDMLADSYGLDADERMELFRICQAVGISQRHAAILNGHALQREHEIASLEALLAGSPPDQEGEPT